MPTEPATPQPRVTVDPRPVSPAFKRVLKEEAGTITGRLADAFGTENITYGLVTGDTLGEMSRALYGAGFDPNYALTEQALKDTAERYAIPEAHRADFYRAAAVAGSAEHLDTLGKSYLDYLERHTRLAEDGIPAHLLYSGVAAVLDPAMLAVGALTGTGAARFISWGSKATRLGKFARGAAVGGVASAGQEAVLSQGDPTRTSWDVAYAGLAGVAVGGALGPLARYRETAGVPVERDAPRVIPAKEALDDRATAANSRPLGTQVSAPSDILPRMTPEEADTRARGELVTTMARRLETLSKYLLDRGEVSRLRQDREIIAGLRVNAEGDVPPTNVRRLAADLGVRRSEAIKRAAELDADSNATRAAERAQYDAEIAAIDERLSQHATAQQAQDALRRYEKTGEIPEQFRAEFDARVAELQKPPARTPVADAVTKALGGRTVPDAMRQDYGIEVDLDVDIPQVRRPTPPGSSRPPAPPTDSTGAARVVGGNDPLVENTSILDKAEASVGAEPPSPKGVVQRLRIDSLNRLIKSQSAKIRALGYALFPDHIETGFAQSRTASEAQRFLDAMMRRDVKRALYTRFPEWAKQRGIAGWRLYTRMANDVFESFNEEVADHIRGISVSNSAEVRAVASEVQAKLAKYLEEGKRAGVFGDDIAPDAGYLPRVFNESRLMQLWADRAIGSFEVTRLVETALIRAQFGRNVTKAQLDDELADAMSTIAKAYVTTIRRASYGMSRTLAYGISADDVDALRGFLLEAGLRGSDVEKVVATVTRRNEQMAKIPNAKRRIDLDETTSIQLKDGRTLGVRDLLENNVDTLFDKYSRRVSGAIALKDKIGIVGSSTERNRLRDEIISELAEYGVDPVAAARQADVAEAFVRRIAGVPVENTEGIFGAHPMSVGVRATEGLRRFNFVTFMVQAGFASVAEFGNVVAKGGWAVLWHGLSNFRQFMRDARTGTVPDETIDFFEQYLGVGADNLLHPMFSRFDDLSSSHVDARALTRFERGLGAASHLVAEKISQLGPMTRFQRRLVMLGMLKRIEDWALRGGADLSEAQKRRLSQAGLTEADLDEIGAHMKKYQVSLQSGYRDRSFTRADLQDWADNDPESFARLMTAIGRETDRTIIEGNIADAPLWMQSQLGRVATQFMTFAINAHTKLLLRGLSLADTEAALAFLYSMGFAAMAYGVQTSINTVGRPEAREKALEAETVLFRAFSRAGPAALVPQVVDSAARMTGFDPVFNGRSTGLPSGTITSIPSISTLDNVFRALDTVPSLLHSDQNVTREHANAMINLAPIAGRLPGLHAGFKYLAEELPRDTESYR